MYNRFFKLMICCSLLYTNSNAQSTNVDSLRIVLKKIDKVFDSAQYLSFNVDIKLSSDTVYGRTESDHLVAHYILHGNNIFYNVGGVDFMQNDTIAINAHNNEQVMFITKNNIAANSALFPVKSFTDSMLNYYYSYYSIVFDTTLEGNKRLSFISDSTDLPYKKILMEYNQDNYMLSKVAYSFMAFPEIENSEDTTIATIYPTNEILKTITMQFFNYSSVDNLDVFNDARYFYFNPNRKEFEAVGKYAGYKVIASNMESTAIEHDDEEVPAPPEAYEVN